MTIQKGQPWGHTYEVPLITRDVDSDWQLARGTQSDIHILTAGDMYTALGKPAAMQIGDSRTLVHIDAMECTITNETTTFSLLASATIEIGQWVGLGRARRYVVVTNGGLLDGRNIAPRAHPNDGSVDVMSLDSSMPMRERRSSRKRALTGAHVPHPSITISRGDSLVFSREYTRERLVIDRQKITSWNSIEIKVHPDYWQVIV